ncbi:MAG: PilX N-terminal domain-containing pilus assembly protein [Candidatus Methylomirabilales bacterium]
MCASGTANSRRGAALVIVMLVMAVLLLAGTTFLTISSTESQIALNERASVQAFHLAEAGLQGAIALADLNNSYTGDSGAIAMGSGQTVRFTLTNTSSLCAVGPAKEVVSTGTVTVPGGQAQVEVHAVIERISYPFRWAAFSAVPNQIITDGRIEKELWLDDDARTDSYDSTAGVYDAASNRGQAGHVGANGDVWLDDRVAVSGNVRAGDARNFTSSYSVSGSTLQRLSPNSDSPGESLPPVTPPVTPSQSFTVGGGDTRTLNPGTYYYTSFSMGNNTTLAVAPGGPVTIYISGNITIGDNVTIGSHPPTQLRIIAKSDGDWSTTRVLNAGNDLRFQGTLYGRNTNITLGDRAQIHGSIIGYMVGVGKNGALHFDQAGLNQELCHGGKYVIRRGTWREVLQ